MAGPLDGLEWDDRQARGSGAQADTTAPPAWYEINWDSTKAAAKMAAYDAPGTQRKVRQTRLMMAATDLARALGKPIGTYDLTIPGAPIDPDVERAIYEPDFWRDLKAYRARNPGFLKDLGNDAADFEARLKKDFQDERAGLQVRMARQGILGNLAGGAIGSQADGLNFASNFIGGPAATGVLGTAKAIAVNGLVNAGVELVETPLIAGERNAQGGELTFAEARNNVAFAFTGGALMTAGTKGLSVAANKAFSLDDRALASAFRQSIEGDWQLSPQQAAALNVLERKVEVDASNPYQRSYPAIDAHERQLSQTLRTLAAMPQPRVPVTAQADRAPAPVAAAAPGGFDMGRYMGRNRSAESSGSDVAKAATSSAFGRYQFTKSTWLRYYERAYGKTGESEAQILAKRADGAMQDKLMAALTADNARALQRAGLPVDDGTVYLAHFLGTGDARRVLAAAPDAPIAGLVRAESIAANRAVFDKITSASELVAWARRKMQRDPGESVPAGAGDGEDGLAMPPDPALSAERPIAEVEPLRIRPDAGDGLRPVMMPDGRAMSLQTFRPDEIGVDAALMQFKSGGDQFGVTERLRGVTQWDPYAAGTVTVWESRDGRRLIADGHQRLGLAKRIQAMDPSQEIAVNAYVMREADGFSAADARIMTAITNIGEGTGTAIDAAKVFRELGIDADRLVASLPPKSALVRDGKALSRLSDEAMGAAINEVIPESYAAAIGHLAPDPAQHMALVDLLVKLDPPNRRQAEAIIRQALDAGFHGETQVELFGTRELTSSLFAFKARALDKTLSELRKLKGAFSVAARNADALDAAGNKIDVGASEAAARGNAQALGLVEALALRKGNAVSEIFQTAAQRLANGEPIGRVVKDTVAELRSLDLERAIADAGRTGEPAVGSGRDGLAAVEDDGLPLDPAELSPATRDELEAAGQGGFVFGDADTGTRFDDPAGDGVATAAQSIWHDIRADEEITAKAAQKAAPGAKTASEEIGLIDLGDGLGPRSISDIDAELTRGEQGIDAIRGCL